MSKTNFNEGKTIENDLASAGPVERAVMRQTTANESGKKDSDPACDSCRCNECSVFRSGGCMAEFVEF